jgi:hypothetical protein
MHQAGWTSPPPHPHLPSLSSVWVLVYSSSRWSNMATS